MPVKEGNIEFYMGPSQLGAPDDLESVIIDFIKGAKKSLDIAVQELENEKIARAIIEMKQKGRQIRLVSEFDYLSVTKAVSDPWNPGGQNEENRRIQNAILRADINAKVDFNPNIFHQKFIIRDGSAVLTGSTNFTPTGVEKNLNHVIIIRDKGVANDYKDEFTEIRKGSFGKQSIAHGPAPRVLDVTGVPVKILFAPDHSPEMEIIKQMAKAKRRIDFVIFTFSKSSGIDDQMISVKGRGVELRGAIENSVVNQKWAATRPLKNAGADLFKVGGGAVGKLHHKLMVIDEQLIIGGSFNYTGPANKLNDENIVVIGDLSKRTGTSANAQKRIARFALKEINRIIDDHGTKI